MDIVPSCRPSVPPLCGIYAITHVRSGRCYVGSTTDTQLRLYDHVRLLRRGKHRNAPLQADWLADGPSAFTFTVLEVVTDHARLLDAERCWLTTVPALYNRRQPARNHQPGPAASVRFWGKVHKTPTCWLWTGSRSKKGYGTFNVGARTYTSAHRYSYVLAYGEVPAGLVIHHTCHTRWCVNPAHLVAATPKENTADIIARGITFVPAPKCGEDAAHAKLTAAQVVAIRAEHAAGATYTALGSAYGVHPSAVYLIVKRKNWRHIP